MSQMFHEKAVQNGVLMLRMAQSGTSEPRIGQVSAVEIAGDMFGTRKAIDPRTKNGLSYWIWLRHQKAEWFGVCWRTFHAKQRRSFESKRDSVC